MNANQMMNILGWHSFFLLFLVILKDASCRRSFDVLFLSWLRSFFLADVVVKVEWGAHSPQGGLGTVDPRGDPRCGEHLPEHQQRVDQHDLRGTNASPVGF